MHRKPKHRNPQSKGEKLIRAGVLARTMASFNVEMGQKVAASIHNYHAQHVEPRLAWLETPWYQKLWIRSKGLSRRIWARINALWDRVRHGKPELVRTRAEGELLPGDRVETSEVGDRLFAGKHQTGVVWNVADGKVVVLADGADEAQIFSPSVWRLIPDEVEA